MLITKIADNRIARIIACLAGAYLVQSILLQAATSTGLFGG